MRYAPRNAYAKGAPGPATSATASRAVPDDSANIRSKINWRDCCCFTVFALKKINFNHIVHNNSAAQRRADLAAAGQFRPPPAMTAMGQDDPVTDPRAERQLRSIWADR